MLIEAVYVLLYHHVSVLLCRSGNGSTVAKPSQRGLLKGSQFDPGLPQSYCRKVLEQDPELLAASGGKKEKVGALHGFLCLRCENV